MVLTDAGGRKFMAVWQTCGDGKASAFHTQVLLISTGPIVKIEKGAATTVLHRLYACEELPKWSQMRQSNVRIAPAAQADTVKPNLVC